LVSADVLGPLAHDLAEAYEESFPWASMTVTVYNDEVAARALRAGEADLALLGPLVEGVGQEWWVSPFAVDGVAVVAHPATPLSNLDLNGLEEIYRGRVQELEGQVLTVVIRETGASTRAVFDRLVLEEGQPTKTAVIASSDEAVLEVVAATPGALGYVSTLSLRGADLKRVDLIPIEGIIPTHDALDGGSYALRRSLSLVALHEPTGPARDFAQWILGPVGQVISGQYGSW
jgi:phosphate transport system substrate-binding protein